MAKGDVTMTFDADTAQAVQSIMAMRDHLISLANPTRKLGDEAKEAESKYRELFDTIKESAHEAAGELGLVTSVAAGVGAAVGAIMEGVEKHMEQVEERAKGLLDRNQSVVQALAASGQQGPGAADRVTDAISHQSGNTYAGGQVFDVAQRTRLFSGISSAVKTSAGVDDKIGAIEDAASGMAGGESEEFAIQRAANALLLKSLAGLSTGEAQRDARDLTPDTGLLSEQQTTLMGSMADKGQAVNLIRLLARGGESAKALRPVIESAQREIAPEALDKLRLKIGNASVTDPLLDLLPDTMVDQDRTFAQQKQAEKTAEEEAHLASERADRQQKDALADRAEAQRVATMKRGEQKKANAEYAISVTQRTADEALQEQQERERFAKQSLKQPADVALSEADTRERFIASIPPSSRLDTILNQPLLVDPEHRQAVEQAMRQPLPHVASATSAAQALAGSETGKSGITQGQIDAFVQGTKTKSEKEDDVLNDIHEARKAIFDRMHPDAASSPDWYKKYFWGPKEEDQAQEKFWDAHGHDGTKFPDEDRLKVLMQLMKSLGISPSATAQPGAQASAGIEGLLNRVITAIQNQTTQMPQAIASAVARSNPSLSNNNRGQA